MSEFEESNKVVCVNDSNEGVFGVSSGMLRFPGGSVVKGGTYCVERAYPGENGTQGLILTEPKIYRREGAEIGFNSTRFRKVHPKAVTLTEGAVVVLSSGEARDEFNVFLAQLRHQPDA